MAELFNLDAVENAALKPLKDFQRMTVDRIYDLYRASTIVYLSLMKSAWVKP